MKNTFRSTLRQTVRFRSLAGVLASGACLFAPAALLGEEERGCPEVALEDSHSGNSYVMVFGEVGDPFAYQLGEAGAGPVRYRQGVSASGDPCELPEGLEFDADSIELRGVPARPGFHEFVLLETERGVTRERVVLIDIQDPSLSAGIEGYAAYFFQGVR